MRKKISIVLIIVLSFVLFGCDITKQNLYEPDFGFTKEKKVLIIGYNKNAMEPFISYDSKYLFFNNLKGPNNKDIYYAKRISDTVFQFEGEIKGVNTQYVDATPTMDEANNFYFVSMRNFPKNRNTIFCGKFNNGVVYNIHQVKGTINNLPPGWVNMGVKITPDGKTLLVSRAKFRKGGSFPIFGNIIIATKNGSKFDILSNNNFILKNINKRYAIEYSAHLSANKLELFYSEVTLSTPPEFKLLHAERTGKYTEFNKPLSILAPFQNDKKAIVEAPCISINASKLYYHKLDNKGIYSIYVLFRRK